MRFLFLWFLAYFRLSGKAVCELSKDLDEVDYHDYTDTVERLPLHFSELTCKRCGKKFII